MHHGETLTNTTVRWASQSHSVRGPPQISAREMLRHERTSCTAAGVTSALSTACWAPNPMPKGTCSKESGPTTDCRSLAEGLASWRCQNSWVFCLVHVDVPPIKCFAGAPNHVAATPGIIFACAQGLRNMWHTKGMHSLRLDAHANPLLPISAVSSVVFQPESRSFITS